MTKNNWRRYPRVRYRPNKGEGFDVSLPQGTTKTQAKQIRADLMRRHRLGNIETLGGSLSDFFDVFMERNKGRQFSTVQKQIRDFEKHIEPAFGKWRLQEIKPSDLQAWQDKMNATLSPNTYKNVRSHFNAIMKAAVADERIVSNPWSGIKGVKTAPVSWSFWDKDQTTRFLRYAKEHDFKVFQVIAFAIYTGLRPGELRGVLRRDIDWQAGTVWVCRTWCTKTNSLKNRTKTGKPRLVPIPSAVLSALSNLRNLKPDEQLFPFLWNSWGNAFFKPLAVKAKLPPIKLHECRHSFASQCIVAGLSMVEIKELLGHAKIATTIDTYTHIADRHKIRSTDMLTAGADWGNAGNVRQLEVSIK